jgi:hypothetical protein
MAGSRARWATGRSGWWWASVVLLGVALVLLVALAASGFALSTRYRPGTAEGLRDIGRGAAVDLRDAHRLLSTLLLWTGVGLVASGLGLAIQRHRRDEDRRSTVWTGVLPVLLLVAIALAAFTGNAIAWDQLALAAVTVGSDLDGIWAAAFDDGIVFVLVDGRELSQADYARGVIAHVALVPLVLLGLGWATARRLTRRPAPAGTTEPVDEVAELV